MATPIVKDEAWGALTEVGEAEREPRMRARYLELAALSDGERLVRLRAMAEAEYALPDEKLRPFTTSRMRVWLGLDLPVAQTIARSYDAVMRQMPGPVAMRRVATVQTMARGFSLEDQERLRSLVPGVFAARTDAVSVVPRILTTPAPAEAKKRSWWPFGRKAS